MKTTRKVLLALLAISLFLLPLAMISLPSTSAVSCSTTILKENGSNNAIQTAINNAENGVTGSIVCVKGGTYPEQLTISQSNIQLIGQGTYTNPVLIQPTSVSFTTNDLDNGQPIGAIILVSSGSSSSSLTGVVIKGLYVDGTLASSSFSGCTDDYIGILYQNAGGSISNNTVNNIYMPVALAGCQDGQGIYVQTSSGQTSSVSITTNVATNYNKNGITCNDAGTTCTIKNNHASFYTAYAPYIGPNGIQIAFGAKGQITSNTVENNDCTLSGICGSGSIAQYQSDGCGIITYLSASGTTVSKNTASGNDLGICTNLDTASVTSNTVSASNYAGIYQYDGTGTYTANSNTLTTSNSIGVEIQNDGTGSATTFVTTLSGDKFTTGTTYIQIQLVAPGALTLHFAGYTYHLSGNTVLNITQP